MIGEVLGDRYELKEKIGEGGMSTVYKARCNKLNRFVAVKILKKELAENEEIVKKFKIEATAIATLSDNNIVNVLDVGTQGDINYIVMEYIKGKTLKDVIKQFGKLNYDTAISMAIQIAKALDCAHKNSIIHRDVKPQNILVTEEGLVKVTDFGIAKSTSSMTLTNTTTIMGSAHYFSPEQAKGSAVDARTDIYSLGVVLYEMVTGKLPFEAESPVTIALKHIQEAAVPPKQINSKIPESLNALILKTMDKDPNNRYQNAKELIIDLQKIKEDPNVFIGDKIATPLDEGHTIIMAAVTGAEINKAAEDSNVIQDKDEYDDEYYDDEYYDDEDEDPNKKKKRKKIIIIVLCVIAALIAMFAIAYAVSGSGNQAKIENTITVPKIKGMTYDQAKVALEREGLVIVDAGNEKSTEPEGNITQVDPEEGTKVESGAKVRVITSSGEDKIKMPVFKESDLATVRTFLNKNGITDVTEIEQYSETIAKGYVIKTDPVADTVLDETTKVTIYISKGVEKKYITPENYTGYEYTDAENRLKTLGFKVTIIEDKTITDKSKDNQVLSQSNLGKSLEVGSEITLTVGKYTAPVEPEKSFKVSEIELKVGMSRVKVEKAIIDKNLKFDPKGEGDSLKGWSPNNSTEVKEGDTITVTFQEKKVDEDEDENEKE